MVQQSTPASPPSQSPGEGWTIATYAAHNEALRQAEQRFMAERDRRMTEVAIEREKALDIKDKYEQQALELARESQRFRDEQANNLRNQLVQERGDYLTRLEYSAAHRELEKQVTTIAEWVAVQQGKSAGIGASAGVIVGGIATMAAFLTVVVIITNLLVGR